MQQEIRRLIRDILSEELGRIDINTPVQSRVENVSINNDSELQQFAFRLLDMAQHRDIRSELSSGQLTFCLMNLSPTSTTKNETGPAVSFEKGLVSEKDITRLKTGHQAIRVGKTVCFTPLAKDEIRRRGIIIERITQ